jgi:cytochrome c
MWRTENKVYWAKCANFHGPDGKGKTAADKATRARDFSSDGLKKKTHAAWTDIIAKGKNKRPSYDKQLTDAEAKDVVIYKRSLIK